MGARGAGGGRCDVPGHSGRVARRGSLLLEAVFALFLLGVAALGALALLTHALATFEVAESRGRAVPPAAGWLHTAPADSAVTPVGPGELRFEGPGRILYLHPRGGGWTIPAPGGGAPGGSGAPVGSTAPGAP